MDAALLMGSGRAKPLPGSDTYENFLVWLDSKDRYIGTNARTSKIYGSDTAQRTKYRSAENVGIIHLTDVAVVEMTNIGGGWGSSYGHNVTDDSTAGGPFILHGLESLEEYTKVVGTRVGLVHCAIGNWPSFPSVARNGLTTSAYTTFPGSRLFRIIYKDPNTGSMVYVEPYAMNLTKRAWNPTVGIGNYSM